LEKIPEQKITYYVYLLANDYAKVNFDNKNFVKRLVDSTWHSFSEQTKYLRQLNNDSLDLMHFTYFGYPVLYQGRFISTIHDTTPFHFKTGKASTKHPLFYELKFQAFKHVITQQVRNSKLIITPTKAVRDELIQTFGTKYQDKIYPVYEGINYELAEIEKAKSKLKESSTNLRKVVSNDPFFIYIGNFYPHKNVEALIEAYSKISHKAKLILIGPDDFFTKRLWGHIDKLKQDKRIIFYRNPTTAELIFFYKNALALIHPSLSEGFGLPIIEAVYYKLPVIASNIKVFRELLGGSYLEFDPKNTSEMIEKINFFLTSTSKTNYGSLMSKFSFQKMAEKTHAFYLQALA